MGTGLTLTGTEKRVLAALAAPGSATATAIMIRARSVGLTRFTLSNFITGGLVIRDGDSYRLTAFGDAAARELSAGN